MYFQCFILLQTDVERLVATTTVTVPHNGPVSAKSVIESFPSTSKQQICSENVDPPSAPPTSCQLCKIVFTQYILT